METEQVRAVRRFNRVVTRRLGVLSDRFLGRGRPLSEARLLYEIGSHGADVRELRARLSLDSGYVSRLLRSLERQGLIQSRRAEHDARVTRASLTPRGQAELNELNRLSDVFADSILLPLREEQRQRLVKAMADVEQLMTVSAVGIAVVSPRSAAATFCLDEYFRELAERFATGFQPAKSISAEPEELTPPAGCFLVARLDDRPVGCGALKIKEGGIGEIKRMWVASSARGLGIGRRLLEALEERAREAGVNVLRLETNKTLVEAQYLYHRSGYHEVARFNDEPYADHWFEKTELQPARGAPQPRVTRRKLQRLSKHR